MGAPGRGTTLYVFLLVEGFGTTLKSVASPLSALRSNRPIAFFETLSAYRTTRISSIRGKDVDQCMSTGRLDENPRDKSHVGDTFSTGTFSCTRGFAEPYRPTLVALLEATGGPAPWTPP